MCFVFFNEIKATVVSGVHANEWITPAALTWMMNEIMDNADSYDCILDRFEWYFVPMMNLDGYEYSHAVDRMWRKTRRNYTEKRRPSERPNSLNVDAPADAECLGADINTQLRVPLAQGRQFE